MQTFQTGLYVAGCFVILSCLVTLFHIYKHLKHYSRPPIQQAIVRILIMVPVYSIASWLSLRFVRYSMYIDLMRDCYEAFVIYSFVSLLINYAEGERKLLEMLEKHPKMHHMFPFNFLPHFKTDRKFLFICKRVVLQYVFIKPLMTALAIVMDELDLYEEGYFKLDRGYLYVTIVNNFSVTFAMYGLLYLYHAIQDDLAYISPLKKLLCIKAVLFISFWQGIVIAILARYKIIHETAYSTLEEVEIELQDFLLCFEMLLAAIAHGYAYSYTEFRSQAAKSVPFGQKFKAVMNTSDFIADVKNTFFTPIEDKQKKAQ